jgi:uncharacterized cupredoxin-like copper-binding protein
VQTGGTLAVQEFLGSGASNPSGGTIRVSKSFRPAGFAATGGTLEFTGNGDATSFPAGTAYQFFSLQIDANFDPKFDNQAGTTFSVAGNWTNNSTAGNLLSNKATTVVFDGSSNQAIGGTVATTFNNLTIDNAAGVTLTANATVAKSTSNGVLTLTSGSLITGSHAMILNSGGTVSGASASSFVVGNLRKQIDANGTLVRTFEVGTGTSYAPVDVTISAVGGSKTDGSKFLTVSSTAGEHSNVATSTLDPCKDVNRYWTLTKGGTWTFASYDVAFHFVTADVDIGANTSNFHVERFSNNAWTLPTTGTVTATSAQATGLTTFGAPTTSSAFAVGEPGTGVCP